VSARGWPDDWDERKAGKDCDLCALIAAPTPSQVFAGSFADVFLQENTVLFGYCVVVWKSAHVAEPSELTASDAAGYWQEVVAVGSAIESVFSPMKINYLTLGNGTPHLHTHVVPRYADDPAAGGPIAWNEMFGERIADDELQKQLAALRAALQPPTLEGRKD
jgi:diadenosine tetraphosphate (Ap4A) HIT family hydrolase